MRTAASLLVGVLVFEILAAPVSALAESVVPGTRIRVTGDWPRHRQRIGSFVTDERDSIWMREWPASSSRWIFQRQLPPESTVVGFAELDVRRFEVSRGLHGDHGLAVLGGTLGGAAFGAFLGANVLNGENTWGLISKGELAGALALVFGVAGFVVGGVISLTRRTEKWEWEPVPVESLEPTVAAADSTG